MNTATRQFKFSGRISPFDAAHRVVSLDLAGQAATAPDERYIAPTMVTVTLKNPPGGAIQVPKYAGTVQSAVNQYAPATDCDGNFMSYKFQANNNCYAYGCNIAPNSFPQPGRVNGYQITTIDGATIVQYAEADGLQYAGKSLQDLQSFAQKRRSAIPPNNTGMGGHFVALMISPKGDQNWPGDYHWARCDDNINFASWSQKDGGDQVTNFDFAGNLITDPSQANWTVNQGPTNPPTNYSDLVVDYAFFCFMFVPDSGVNIL